MATYYVSKTGSNGAATTLATAKTTIDAGIQLLASGDTLLINDGVYDEYIHRTIPNGTAGFPTTIRAINNRQAVVFPTSSDYYVLLISGESSTKSYITIDGIKWKGVNSGSVTCFFPGNINNLIFKNNEIEDSGLDQTGGLELGQHGYHGGQNCQILNNYIHNIRGYPSNLGHGIYIIGSNNIIDGNEVYDVSGGYGIHIWDNSGIDADVNNIFRNNKIHTVPYRAGILMGSTAENSAIYNNIIYDCDGGIELNGYNCYIYNNTIYQCVNNGQGGTCIKLLSPGTGHIIRNNIGYLNPTEGISLQGGTYAQADHNAFGINPVFENAGSGNFHLTASTPTTIKDAGVNLGLPFNVDFDGAPRPQGTGWDLGALEYIISNPTNTYYVSKTGSNSNPGTQAQPWLTINYALAHISGGSTLIIGNGIYNEGLRSNIPSGTSSNPTIIKAQTARQVFLRPTDGNYYGIAFQGTGTFQYITIDGLYIDNAGALSAPVYVSMDPGGTAHHLTFQNGVSTNSVDDGSHSGNAGLQLGQHGNIAAHHHFTVTNWECVNNIGVGFYFICSDSVMDNCYSHANGSGGLQIYTTTGSGANNNIIKNSRFTANLTRNNQITNYEAIIVSAGTGNLIYNNLIWNHLNPASGTAYGIRTYTNAINTGIYNNVIYRNANDCIFVDIGSSGTLIKNNIFYLNGSDTIGGQNPYTAISNSSGVDPKFIDAAAANFHLRSDSPCIDQGVDLSSIFTTDFDGVTRA